MFQYIDCGLSDVWLTNGYKHKETGTRTSTDINDKADLLHLIALQLINRRGPLISMEMRFLRHAMNLSRQSLGDELGVDKAFITHWERNNRRLPRYADVHLRILYAATRLTACDNQLSVHLLADGDYPSSPAPMMFTWSDAGWRHASCATPP